MVFKSGLLSNLVFSAFLLSVLYCSVAIVSKKVSFSSLLSSFQVSLVSISFVSIYLLYILIFTMTGELDSDGFAFLFAVIFEGYVVSVLVLSVLLSAILIRYRSLKKKTKWWMYSNLIIAPSCFFGIFYLLKTVLFSVG